MESPFPHAEAIGNFLMWRLQRGKQTTVYLCHGSRTTTACALFALGMNTTVYSSPVTTYHIEQNQDTLSEDHEHERWLHVKQTGATWSPLERLLAALHTLFHEHVRMKLTKHFPTSTANRVLWAMAEFHASAVVPHLEYFLGSHETDPKLRDIEGTSHNTHTPIYN